MILDPTLKCTLIILIRAALLAYWLKSGWYSLIIDDPDVWALDTFE